MPAKIYKYIGWFIIVIAVLQAAKPLPENTGAAVAQGQLIGIGILIASGCLLLWWASKKKKQEEANK